MTRVEFNKLVLGDSVKHIIRSTLYVVVARKSINGRRAFVIREYNGRICFTIKCHDDWDKVSCMQDDIAEKRVKK